MVAVNKVEQVPSGWIIDKHGAPTTEPKDFYAGGALLTVGGHKGSGTGSVVPSSAGSRGASAASGSTSTHS